MSLGDNIEHITTILKDDGLLLCPSNNFWILACHCDSKIGINRLINLSKKSIISTPFLVCSSIDMLKKLVPDLHPRVETLLVYHHKPLIINYPISVYDDPVYPLDNNNEMSIKLIRDTFCSEIISSLNRPLVAAYALDKTKELCIDAAEIDPDCKSYADYITHDIYGDDQSDMIDVMASYDSEGNLLFQ